MSGQVNCTVLNVVTCRYGTLAEVSLFYAYVFF